MSSAAKAGAAAPPVALALIAASAVTAAPLTAIVSGADAFTTGSAAGTPVG